MGSNPSWAVTAIVLMIALLVAAMLIVSVVSSGLGTAAQDIGWAVGG